MAASFSLLALSAMAHMWGELCLALKPQKTMIFLPKSASGSTP